MASLEADAFIERLGLQPHPEGGYYRETYRSEASTAIYYLLPFGQISMWHRIASDECWHFYAGSPLCVVQLTPEGDYSEAIIGPNQFQHVVPAGHWFGAYSLAQSTEAFSLVGCTVAPAFSFQQFELATVEQLIQAYPQQAKAIKGLLEKKTDSHHNKSTV